MRRRYRFDCEITMYSSTMKKRIPRMVEQQNDRVCIPTTIQLQMTSELTQIQDSYFGLKLRRLQEMQTMNNIEIREKQVSFAGG